jgi:EmrB/QacA subfamily drug resistance transporter
VIATVALGAILAPLNSTMIAVALPSIVDDLRTTVGSAGWLITSYLLALAVVQPIAGKLGDRHGRRPFVLGGLAVFGVASVGAALAPTLTVLIALRVTQALAIAVVFPNGVGLVRELVPARRRGRAFGLVGACLSLAAGLGPPLGGLLLSVGGWRSIFWVNLPVVVAALVLAWRTIPRQEAVERDGPFDWPGAALLALVLGGAAALALEGRHAPWTLVPGVPLLLGCLVVFLRREARHPDPVLQPRFFTRRGFAAATGAVASSNLAFYTLLLAVPILLQRHGDWSSFDVGLILALLSLPTVLLSSIGGRLADRLGRRPPAVAGCVLLVGGLAPLALSPGLGTTGLATCLVLAGAGVGLSSAGMQAAAVEAVEAQQSGVAAGIYSTARYVGSFAGSIALARLLDGGIGLAGFRAVFVMALAGALASVAATLLLPGSRVAGARR